MVTHSQVVLSQTLIALSKEGGLGDPGPPHQISPDPEYTNLIGHYVENRYHYEDRIRLDLPQNKKLGQLLSLSIKTGSEIYDFDTEKTFNLYSFKLPIKYYCITEYLKSFMVFIYKTSIPTLLFIRHIRIAVGTEEF